MRLENAEISKGFPVFEFRVTECRYIKTVIVHVFEWSYYTHLVPLQLSFLSNNFANSTISNFNWIFNFCSGFRQALPKKLSVFFLVPN